MPHAPETPPSTDMPAATSEPAVDATMCAQPETLPSTDMPAAPSEPPVDATMLAQPETPQWTAECAVLFEAPQTPPSTDMSAAPSKPAEDATMDAEPRTPPWADNAAAPSASGHVPVAPPPAADAVQMTVERLQDLTPCQRVEMFVWNAPGRVERSRSREVEIVAEEVDYAERDKNRTQHGHAGPLWALGSPDGLHFSCDWPGNVQYVEPARGGIWAEPGQAGPEAGLRAGQPEITYFDDPEPEATAGKAPRFCWTEELLDFSEHDMELLQKDWQQAQAALNLQDRSPWNKSPQGKLHDFKREIMRNKSQPAAAKVQPKPKSPACSSADHAADAWANYKAGQCKRKGSATSHTRGNWASVAGSDEDEHEEEQAGPGKKSNKPEDNKDWWRHASSTSCGSERHQWHHSH